MASQISNISQAFAARRAAASNISSERSTANKEDLGAVAVKGSRGTNILPTPPNSISPNLPPQWRARGSKEVPTDSPTISVVDSDLDLHDAIAISLGQAALDINGGNDDHGRFTPTYLAKFLADILQDKGPLPVRHVMNHLTQVVPGFIDVPPARARRLTTAALENRKGDLDFEKIGWGKWATRSRGGQTPMSQVSPRLDPIQEGRQPTRTSSTTAAISIPGSHGRRAAARQMSQGSWTGASSLSRAETVSADVEMMSIDGEENKRRAQTRQDSTLPTPLDYSDTDEEDWASMGAAALRQGSLSSTGGRSFKSSMTLTHDRPRRPSFTPYGRSMPGPRSLGKHRPSDARPLAPQNLDFTGVEVDEKEKDAIAALVRMGSYN